MFSHINLKSLAYARKGTKIRRELFDDYCVICSFHLGYYKFNSPLDDDRLFDMQNFERYSYHSFMKTFETCYRLAKDLNGKCFYVILKTYGRYSYMCDIVIIKVDIVTRGWLHKRMVKQMDLLLKQYARKELNWIKKHNRVN